MLRDSGIPSSSVRGHGGESAPRRQVRWTLTNRAGSVSTLNTTSSQPSQRAMAITRAPNKGCPGDTSASNSDSNTDRFSMGTSAQGDGNGSGQRSTAQR
jgi:hypothetical protein